MNSTLVWDSERSQYVIRFLVCGTKLQFKHKHCIWCVCIWFSLACLQLQSHQKPTLTTRSFSAWSSLFKITVKRDPWTKSRRVSVQSHSADCLQALAAGSRLEGMLAVSCSRWDVFLPCVRLPWAFMDLQGARRLLVALLILLHVWWWNKRQFCAALTV